MSTGYELWDTQTGNLLDDWDTEGEAVQAVRQLIVLNGPGTTDDLALVYVGEGDESRTIALGPALEEHVTHRGAEQPRRTA